LPSALADGYKGDKGNRPRESLFQDINLISYEKASAVKKAVRSIEIQKNKKKTLFPCLQSIIR
jgi:hypothetical protein